MPSHFVAETTEKGFRLLFQGNTEVEIETRGLWEEQNTIESINTVSYSILNNVQDAVTMVTRNTWPVVDNQPNSLPLPEVRWSDNTLELSFQLDGKDVLKLEPIDFDGLLN